MPEYLELHFMVKMVQQQVQLRIVVRRVRRLGTNYKNPDSAKENRLDSFIDELPSVFIIRDIQQRGKEVAISCQSFTIVITSFGKGAYLYFIDDESKLQQEPFKSDGWIAFEGISLSTNKYCALLIVDCRSYRHEVEIRKRTRSNFWTITKGPCILNEVQQFYANFMNKLKSEQKYFMGHSVAYVLFDQKLFNGIGEYSASEILFRLYQKHQVKPFDNFWKTIMKNHSFFQDFLRSPLLFYEECKNFQKKFDPANYGIQQRQLSRSFRLHFLKVYGKKSYKGQEVVAVAFKTAKATQTVYTLKSLLKNIPAAVAKSKRKVTKKSNLQLDGLQQRENWHLVRGKRFTKKDIFVGPFEWHRKSEKKDLMLNGLSPNRVPKGPSSRQRSDNYRFREIKRSGRKCEKKRQARIWDGIINPKDYVL